MVHDRPRHLLVLLQHWGFAPQQVLAQQLWLQVPYLPHHVSHDGLFASQLYCYCLDEDGSFADHTVSSTVLENFLSQSCFLLVGGLWERLSSVPSGVVQSGGRGHHALLYGCVRLFNEGEKGGLDNLSDFDSCGHRRHHCQRGKIFFFNFIFQSQLNSTFFVFSFYVLDCLVT